MKDNVIPLGDPATHFWLTRSSARVMGINLSDKLAAGQLSAEDYARMVAACRRCSHVHDCQTWLATEAVPREQALAECPIRALLELLQ